MENDSATTSLIQLRQWVESLPEDRVNWTINENPSVNSTNLDYYVDYEISVKPIIINALGITIWISNDAIGFFISNFKHAAQLLCVKVRNKASSFACSGSEPITHIDIGSTIDICSRISAATLDLNALIFNGRLEGICSEVALSNNYKLPILIGTPHWLAKLLVASGFAESKSIPYEPWT